MASDGEPQAGNHRELASEQERLADEDRGPAGADRDPAGATGVTLLERRARWLPVAEISYFPGLLATLPLLGVVVAIAAPAVWLLRRQSAHPVR